MIDGRAAAVELEVGRADPVELQAEKPVGGKYKLTFTGAVEAEWDGSRPASIEIPEGGGGAQGPVTLDGTGDVIHWDASLSANAIVRVADKKPIEVANAKAGQTLMLQCYGHDLDFSGDGYRMAETMNYLFCEPYQHWLYCLYYDGEAFDVTGQPVGGTS